MSAPDFPVESHHYCPETKTMYLGLGRQVVGSSEIAHHNYDIERVIDAGGDDRYGMSYPEGIYEIVETPDGGRDTVIPGLIDQYTLPENVEDLQAVPLGDTDFRHFVGNELDNFFKIQISFKPLFYYEHSNGVLYEGLFETLGGDDIVRVIASAFKQGHEGSVVVLAGDGDDRVMSQEGNDWIEGGTGNDRVDAGPGRDTVKGEDGRDWLLGEDGNDALDGGEDDDLLEGGAGKDMLEGGAGDDVLIGDAGGDYLRGDAGNDTLRGKAGRDTLNGGADDDKLWGGANPDTFVFEGGDFGDDIVYDYGHHGNYEDKFLFSATFFGDDVPDIGAFVDTYVALVDGGHRALVDLTSVGGGTVLILGDGLEPFDLGAFEADIEIL